MNILLKSCYLACATLTLLSSCGYQQKPTPIIEPAQASTQSTPQPVKTDHIPAPSATQLQGSPAQTTLQNAAEQTLPISITPIQTAGNLPVITATNTPQSIATLPKINDKKNEKSLDFMVENTAGKTIYATCFVYLRKDVYTRWRWVKSATYSINDNKTATIHLPSVSNETDRDGTFGYLGIFDTQQEADDATYELTPDRNKLDLDVLAKLKDKKVTLQTEKYGFKKPFIDFDFVDLKKKKQKQNSELDFLVQNNTHKTIYVCSFCYMKKAKGTWIAAVDDKDDMANWRYDKTPLLQLKHGETGYIDIDTIESNRDRANVIGFLGIFDEDEKEIAEKSTYELLSPQHKLPLDKLKNVANKKIILEIEQYGLQGDLIDYTIKPVKKIDWTSVVGTPKK